MKNILAGLIALTLSACGTVAHASDCPDWITNMGAVCVLEHGDGTEPYDLSQGRDADTEGRDNTGNAAGTFDQYDE